MQKSETRAGVAEDSVRWEFFSPCRLVAWSQLLSCAALQQVLQFQALLIARAVPLAKVSSQVHNPDLQSEVALASRLLYGNMACNQDGLRTVERPFGQPDKRTQHSRSRAFDPHPCKEPENRPRERALLNPTTLSKKSRQTLYEKQLAEIGPHEKNG
eukprot:3236035-Amphidinium_carterae.1